MQKPRGRPRKVDHRAVIVEQDDPNAGPLFRMVVTHVHAMLGGGRKANRGDIIEVNAKTRKSLLFTQGAKDA